jgi:hypothetical protein
MKVNLLRGIGISEPDWASGEQASGEPVSSLLLLGRSSCGLSCRGGQFGHGVENDARGEYLREELRSGLARRVERVDGHSAAAERGKGFCDSGVLEGPVGAQKGDVGGGKCPRNPGLI